MFESVNTHTDAGSSPRISCSILSNMTRFLFYFNESRRKARITEEAYEALRFVSIYADI